MTKDRRKGSSNADKHEATKQHASTCSKISGIVIAVIQRQG